ncbi:MAG: hypothetical protein C0179_04705 [Fervidicoccus sp.]|nr:MAG: hypothetical protein C0179_04705 [Fervidicoccus sp.]
MSTTLSATMEFENIEKLKQFVEKRIAELSAELGEVLRRIDALHGIVENKRRVFEALGLKFQDRGYEGIKLGGDITIMIDPPPDALVNIYEGISENLNKELNAYRNLKNALSKLPSSPELSISATLVLDQNIPKHIVLKTVK